MVISDTMRAEARRPAIAACSRRRSPPGISRTNGLPGEGDQA